MLFASSNTSSDGLHEVGVSSQKPYPGITLLPRLPLIFPGGGEPFLEFLHISYFTSKMISILASTSSLPCQELPKICRIILFILVIPQKPGI